jgi:hypothetical protein
VINLKALQIYQGNHSNNLIEIMPIKLNLNLCILSALKSRVTPTPKALEAGHKQPRPSYIPPHLPAFPDPHSYVKTPVSFYTD